MSPKKKIKKSLSNPLKRKSAAASKALKDASNVSDKSAAKKNKTSKSSSKAEASAPAKQYRKFDEETKKIRDTTIGNFATEITTNKSKMPEILLKCSTHPTLKLLDIKRHDITNEIRRREKKKKEER